MVFKTFSFWIWFILICVLSLVLASIPLFNILAFEFCAIITVFIVFASAHVAMTELQVMKRSPGDFAGTSYSVIIRCFLRSLRSNAILLLIPLIIILLNALRIKNCNFIEGFLFYLLLPSLSCVAVTAGGLFFNVWIEKRWLAYLAYLIFLIVSCVPTLTNLIFHPPVFAYHPILGYFPGPIYDFVISITPTLLISRFETLLLGFLFFTVTLYTTEISRRTGLTPKIRLWNLIKVSSRYQLFPIATISFIFIAILGVEIFSGKIGIRPTRQDIEEELGGYRESAHFEIYYSRELHDEIDLFVEDCEFRYDQLTEYLQTENSRKVRVYLYNSPQQKKRLIGAGDTYVEDPFGYGFHVHVQGFPHPVLKHELAHVLTADWSPWKVSLNVGMHEGVAVAADWEEDKLTVHQWAKAMRELNVAPALSSVMGLGFWRHAGSRSYLMAGSFIRFLIDKYGVENIKRAFPTGNLSKSFAKDFHTLEQEWSLFLTDEIFLKKDELTFATRRLIRGGIFEQVCAHEMASLRGEAWGAYYRQDFHTAVESFQKMLLIEPANARNYRGLMYSAFQSGNYELALSIAKQIIADANSPFRAEATLLQGDMYWLQGNIEEAKKIYDNAYSLVQRESVQKSVLKRISALSDSFSHESKDKLKRVLVPKSHQGKTYSGTKMALLQQIIRNDPNEWLTYYLVGQLLHEEREWDLSTVYLRHALDLGSGKDTIDMPNAIRLDTLWSLGMNAYRKKDFAIAERVYSEIAADEDLSLGDVLVANVWVERCQWARKTKP